MDKELILWIQSHSNSILDIFFGGVVHLSSKTALCIYIVIAYLFTIFFSPKYKKNTNTLVTLLVFSSLINYILKNTFQSLRPYMKYHEILGRFTASGTGYSFPSGHAQLISTIGFFIYFNTKSRLIRTISIVVMILVCFSRMYFGLHYFTDIVAGVIIGLALNLAIKFYRKS